MQSCSDAFKIENHFGFFVINSIDKCSFYLYVLYCVLYQYIFFGIIQSTLSTQIIKMVKVM